ncbi:MAG: AraC family ligand binding domain-containing protein [Acidobacteriota bacterium]
MERFTYTKAIGLTVLSASMTDFVYKRHAHEEYALGVTLKGVQQYHLGGTLYSSHPNGVMLFNPEQVHDGCSGDPGGLEYVMLYVPTALFAQACGLRDAVRFDAPVVYDGGLAAGILRLAGSVAAGRDPALISEQLLDVASRAARTSVCVQPGRKDAAVRRAMEFMRASQDGHLRLSDLCGEVRMSKYHFIRHFKALTGISPYQFFLNCKAEQAKRLLEESGDVYAAVLRHGFCDLSHLNRHFKRIYGVTASEYARTFARGALRAPSALPCGPTAHREGGGEKFRALPASLPHTTRS